MDQKDYSVYENIILNNSVVMTRVECTHALKLITYKQILLYTNQIPISEFKRM